MSLSINWKLKREREKERGYKGRGEIAPENTI